MLATFLTLALVFLHGAGLVLALRAILVARTPPAAIGWTLGLLVFPVLTIPLFLVFGQSRFSGYVLAGEGEVSELDALLQAAEEAVHPFGRTLEGRYEDLSTIAVRATRFPPLGGNRAKLLVDGNAAFDAMFAAIDRAETFVLVQFFIIHDDRIGLALRERLVAAVRRGVMVCVLYDSVGSKDLPWEYGEELRKHGARVVPFVTNRTLGVRFQVNFRNHRKMLIVDGRTAFTGGLNVGDEYLGRSKRFGPWRDTHIQIEGPAVIPFLMGYVEDWHYAADEILHLPRFEPAACGDQIMIPFLSGPMGTIEVCPAIYLEAIRLARRRLWIATPYFVPDAGLRMALQHAAMRGVDVRILLPGMADHTLPWLSAYAYYPALRHAGIRLFRLQPGFMHQKVLLTDNDFAIVGSVNMDYRSFMLNFEGGVLVRDAAFATEVDAMFKADFENSNEEDLTLFERGSLGFRLKVRCALLASPEQ